MTANFGRGPVGRPLKPEERAELYRRLHALGESFHAISNEAGRSARSVAAIVRALERTEGNTPKPEQGSK